MSYPPWVFSSQHMSDRASQTTFAMINHRSVGPLYYTRRCDRVINWLRNFVQTRIPFAWPDAKCLILWTWRSVSKSQIVVVFFMWFFFFTRTDYTMSPRCEWHYVQYIFRLHRIIRARFITWCNYKSAAFEYRIFYWNQNLNIRFPNYSKMHSPKLKFNLDVQSNHYPMDWQNVDIKNRLPWWIGYHDGQVTMTDRLPWRTGDHNG